LNEDVSFSLSLADKKEFLDNIDKRRSALTELDGIA
jgi:hypothetical protein